ncbi:DNA polymerase IV [Corynebacterium sp. 13CS0277]|uniref:DNA polymerase IV n=1 Tax=Corynebacterium sp. 13CS0277 TaxID=2071994 RepID=UPI000D0284BE|nr:DNA polymerase IV [Corynebacterium sp. 13CS0277]PRQ11162.1 DNA polymerase IV [Corynebacterium sp. 13CS0277]
MTVPSEPTATPPDAGELAAQAHSSGAPTQPRRWVLHIDMDAFFASVEQLTRPTLRGRPVLVGGVDGRGVVAGASYEARAFGVHSAMPMWQAKKLAGFSSVTVRPRRAVYVAASRRVFDIISRAAGVVEQLSIDEAFLEPAHLQGADASEVVAWAEALRAEIAATTGLPSSVGAGSGKQYAKIASGLAKPDGVHVIHHATQQEQISVLPVRSLWGIGPVAEAKLHSAGIRTIGDFAALRRADAVRLLGQAAGSSLHELAQGRDDRPTAPRKEAKSIGAEHTYPQDLTTTAHTDEALRRAFDAALRRFRKDPRGAKTVTVKIKLSDFSQHTRSATLPHPTSDEDVLWLQATTLVRYPADVGPIRLVGVSFSNLEHAHQQVMFPELDRLLVTTRQEHQLARDAERAAEWEAGMTMPQPAPTDASGAEGGEDAGPQPTHEWWPTRDVWHPDYGHGWVQGSGHGVVSVRFETRTTTTPRARSFAVDDPLLEPADPLDSLEWGLGEREIAAALAAREPAEDARAGHSDEDPGDAVPGREDRTVGEELPEG